MNKEKNGTNEKCNKKVNCENLMQVNLIFDDKEKSNIVEEIIKLLSEIYVKELIHV